MLTTDTPKKQPPSKAQVKCLQCKKVFCKKSYFIRNNWEKVHGHSGLDPQSQWVYVEQRTQINKWEKLATPITTTKRTIPSAFNTALTRSNKRQMKRKIQNMSATKDAEQNKIPRYIKSTVKIENPVTAFPKSVTANKDATEV